MIVWPAKDPVEVLDYSWIVPLDGDDTIASRDVTRTSGTAVIDSTGENGGTVTAWLSGGLADEISYFSLTATTAGGRTFREVAVLPVIDRAAVLLADFRLRYPALASIDDGQVSFWLAKAGAEVGTNWGDSRDSGRIALAAHHLAGAVSTIPAGVTSFRSGDFAATLSDSVANRTGYQATAYGREFMTLRRAVFGVGAMPAWSVADV